MAGHLSSVFSGLGVLFQGSSAPGQLASVREESTTGFAASYPPGRTYLESIRSVSVVWPEWRFRSNYSSGSNYSSDSGASRYNSSGYSSGSASDRTADLGASELTKIANRMVSDGYTQRMAQAFGCGGSQYRALENWFVELDVDWVLEIRGGHGIQRQLELLLQDTSASWLHELVERWVRALTIIVVSISKELVADVDEMPAAARFGKASVSAMLVFVNAILNVFKMENLPAVLHMYICVSNASYDLRALRVVSSEAQSIFCEIGASLQREENKLIQTISSRMWNMRMTLIDGDDSWAIEIPQGGGEVHRKTQMLVDCVLSMRKAQALMQNSTQSHKIANLGRLIDETVAYTKDLLLTKSKLCSDPSLRYLFLLNNFYFIAQVSDPSIPLDVELGSRQHSGLELTPECEKHMNSYLDVSWRHVLSCIPKSNFHGPLQRWKNTSSLAKFESAFHKTYQAQKFWKVPEPQPRDVLWKTITERVISGYRDYLKEHPELAEHISRGSSSPEVLEQMLGELFEG